MFLIAVLSIGLFFQWAFKSYPAIFQSINWIDRNDSYFKVDLNKSSAKELMKIPYIGEYSARQIVLYRERNGSFKSVDDIKKVKGIRLKNYEKFSHYLEVK